jgi:predicted nuclease with TOPRIM domain
MSDDTIQLTAKGWSELADDHKKFNAELQKQLDERDELIRCLRVARDLYRSETYELRERISELEQENDGLRDDNMNLSAMQRSAYRTLFGQQRVEVAA